MTCFQSIRFNGKTDVVHAPRETLAKGPDTVKPRGSVFSCLYLNPLCLVQSAFLDTINICRISLRQLFSLNAHKTLWQAITRLLSMWTFQTEKRCVIWVAAALFKLWQFLRLRSSLETLFQCLASLVQPFHLGYFLPSQTEACGKDTFTPVLHMKDQRQQGLELAPQKSQCHFSLSKLRLLGIETITEMRHGQKVLLSFGCGLLLE